MLGVLDGATKQFLDRFRREPGHLFRRKYRGGRHGEIVLSDLLVFAAGPIHYDWFAMGIQRHRIFREQSFHG